MYQKRDIIMRLYLSNFKKRYYLREISKLTNIPLRTTQRLLQELEDDRIIRSRKEGKNKYYFLNLQNIKTKFYLLIAEINKTLIFLEEYPVFHSFLKEKINSCLVVFGSFAEFRATKTSDLDLLVIGKEEPSFHLLPYEIHKIKISEKQFEKGLAQDEPLLKEILKNHVVLTNHSYFLEKLWNYYGKD